MNISEFKSQIDRLKSVYGERSYPEEREEIIWREMRYLLAFEFERIVSELIGTNATAPMLTKFREAKFDLGRKNAGTDDKELSAWIDAQPNCSLCNKTGAVLAKRKADMYQFAFMCSCALGQRKHPRLPRWDISREDAYTREMFSAPPPKTALVKIIEHGKLNPQSLFGDC